jgi:hypothetical protein
MLRDSMLIMQEDRQICIPSSACTRRGKKGDIAMAVGRQSGKQYIEAIRKKAFRETHRMTKSMYRTEVAKLLQRT